MKKWTWKRYLACVLAMGMLFGMPASAIAEEVPGETLENVQDPEEEAEEETEEEQQEEERVSPLENVDIKKLSDGEINRLINEESANLTGDEIAALKNEQARRAELKKQEEREAAEEEAKAREAEKAEEKKDSESGDNKEAGETSDKDDKDNKTDDKDNKADDKDSSDETDKQEDTAPKTNSELIAMQNIEHAPRIIEDFRFWTVARVSAFAKEETPVRERASGDGRAVGTLKKDGLCYLLKEESENWYYVESGEVRGFVHKDALTLGEEAEKSLADAQELLAKKKQEEENDALTLADIAPLAEKLVEPGENAAYNWYRATIEKTIISKDYALAVKDGVAIREEKKEDARVIGELGRGGLCYIVADRDADWIYVESGDVRGFVAAADLKKDEKPFVLSDEDIEAFGASVTEINLTEEEAEALEAGLEAFRELREQMEQEKRERAGKPDIDALLEMELDPEDTLLHDAIAAAGEEQFATAKQKVVPEENAALYYTQTSPFPGVAGGKERASLLDFAKQFMGNRYIWGGTSLTTGADCSGFVQSIYAQYGYYLPRTSREQALYGTQIPVDEAEPGDLIFYAKGGAVYHVVIYAGDGRTIESKSARAGVVMDEVNRAAAVWATRVMEDKPLVYDDSSEITEKNVTPGQYGESLGKFKISFCCSCEKCAGEAGEDAVGTRLTQGRTVAVDPNVIPFGKRIVIGGHIYTTQDCGCDVKGNHIKIYVDDHEIAERLDDTYASVHMAK